MGGRSLEIDMQIRKHVDTLILLWYSVAVRHHYNIKIRLMMP